MAKSVNIPTIDLSAFFINGDDEEGKKKVTEIFKQACFEYGLFQVVNHGVPMNLINQAMELCTEFFDLPNEEKLKFQHKTYDPLPYPHGYLKHPAAKSEVLVMTPKSYALLKTQPTLQVVMDELFASFTETCQVLEGIVNDCLGLPKNMLKEYNDDRSMDTMLSFRYSPATEYEDINGTAPHQDPCLFNLIFQDAIGGLQLLRDGEWIPVDPIQDALVFHVSDVLQVLTNNKVMSPFHQVVRPKGKTSRYSCVFFYNSNREKWVEPLTQFTTEIGEPPKYKKFQYKEYFDVRVEEKLNPPARTEDKTRIIKFAYAT